MALCAIQRTLSRTTTSIIIRPFHTSSSSRASILFALAQLSNARETQHLGRISKLSRIEHSPSLKLIQTSEVHPYPLPSPPPAPVVRPAKAVLKDARRVWNTKALAVGREVLYRNAERVSSLEGRLRQAQRSAEAKGRAYTRQQSRQEAEIRKLKSDLRVAGTWVLLTIGVCTALATWRSWPGTQPSRLNFTDSASRRRELEGNSGSLALTPAAAVLSIPSPTAALAQTEVVFEKAATSLVLPASQNRVDGWLDGWFWKKS